MTGRPNYPKLSLHDVYTATPPNVSQDIIDVINAWVAENPRYGDTEKAKGRCAHASGSFLRYALSKGVHLNALELFGYYTDIAGGEPVGFMAYHVVVDLGNNHNIFDPSARQYHVNAPVPAYATWASLSEMWKTGTYRTTRGVGKVFKGPFGKAGLNTAWQLDVSDRRHVSNNEVMDVLRGGFPPGLF